MDWAETALEMGYADQSHMIAEFRCFSSLTPEQIAHGHWFHPFIERARAQVARFALAQDPLRVNTAIRR